MDLHTSARLRLVAAAALFSTGGAAIKSISLSGWQVACFRSGIAAAVLLLAQPATRRGFGAGTWLVGLAYAATLVLFALATKLTTAANAIFLQDTAPLYVLLLGPLLLREPVRRADLGTMAAVLGGMALFFVGGSAPTASAPDPLRGNALAALSGGSWALTVCGLRWLGARGHDDGEAARAVVAGNLLACALCLPWAWSSDGAGTARDWALIAYLGVFQVGLAYMLVTAAVRQLSAFEVAVILLLEPALNPLWAWLVHGEVPGPGALCGGALIVGATAVRPWLEARRLARPGQAAAAGD